MEQSLLNLAVSKSRFNTNNGWGFGGAVGTEHKFANGSRIRVGYASFRHLASIHFVAIYDKSGNRVWDETTFPKGDALDKITFIVIHQK